MKVLTVNTHDIQGGAARAAYRIHHALRDSSVDSTMLVNYASAGDCTVQGPRNKWTKLLINIRIQLGHLFRKSLRTENTILHSTSMLPSRRADCLNLSKADVIHLHWINGEMISVSDIGYIRKPIVWTLHDMWAFCGAEHYTKDYRWRDGYTKKNRPDYESGFDLNRWVWNKKRHFWKQPMHIVCPSNWLADCARKSMLMKEWPIEVIPNTVNTKYWRPENKSIARQLLNLPTDVPLVLFGAMGEGKDPRKGFDLLCKSLQFLRGEIEQMELVIFGQLAPGKSEDLGFPVNYAGFLHDDISLRLLYSAADLLVIPSRQDNLPNTGVESLACGTPVVAFNTCGLPDIVCHKETGYLAKAFVSEDLAEGIRWVLNDSDYNLLCQNARNYAVQTWSNEIVVQQYINIYQQAVTDLS